MTRNAPRRRVDSGPPRCRPWRRSSRSRCSSPPATGSGVAWSTRSNCERNSTLRSHWRRFAFPVRRRLGRMALSPGQRERGPSTRTGRSWSTTRCTAGRAGYQVVTPLRLDDGRVVLVNRGWIAAGATRAEPPREAPPPGRVVVVGRLNATPGYFEFDHAGAGGAPVGKTSTRRALRRRRGLPCFRSWSSRPCRWAAATR